VSSPGHGDNAVEVPFGPLAAAGGVTPFWDASGATCTVACHGANLEGATNPAPSWTGGDAEVSCGSCHGLPPNDGGDSTGQNGHDSHVRGRGMSCGQCHAGYSSTAVVKATHVDGVRDVAFGYAAPDPALYATDPVTACTAAPVTLTATLTSGWDCTECHALRYVWIDDCCGYVPANPWCQP
jgi:predicted CxxxxCH...CXXCH cytochrome family protein